MSAAFSGVTGFAVHNLVRHIRKLESVSWMIYAFYVLSLMSATSHAIFFLVLGCYPRRSPFYFDGNDQIITSVLELIGGQTFKLLCWLIIVITFQLAMALRVLLRWTSEQKAYSRTKVMIIATVILSLFETLLILIMPSIVSDQRTRSKIISLDQGIQNSLMAVSFAVILYIMIVPLNSFKQRGSSFSSQKKSVILQFCFFELAFVWALVT